MSIHRGEHPESRRPAAAGSQLTATASFASAFDEVVVLFSRVLLSRGLASFRCANSNPVLPSRFNGSPAPTGRWGAGACPVSPA